MLLDPRHLPPATQLAMAILLAVAWLTGQIALHASGF